MALSNPATYLPGIVVTAAIDIGTACSGYAFSFRDNPHRIYASVWNSTTTAHIEATKAPTTILLHQNGQFFAFGFDAEEKYSELAETGQHHGLFYFQNFKMELYRHEKLSRETKLRDIDGKEMSAMNVFAIVITHLKEKLTEETRLSRTDLEDHEIFWILTVPAIWSDAAKQFMREAAKKAGIDNNQLKLVLEPEAASLYCQVNYTRRDVQAGAIAELKHFPVGHKYIVADLGGGTADIATHEVLEDGNLREIYRATGDELGGNRVNLAFARFLENLVGLAVLNEFKFIARNDYLELFREFEIKKRRFKADNPEPIRLRCPASLADCIQKIRKLTLIQLIEEEKFTNLLKMINDKIQMSPKLVNVFFEEPVGEIVSKLKEIIQSEKFEIDTMLLVGGFADSPYVRERIIREIKHDFHDINIVKPEEAALHVLKGAVLMAMSPNQISERISRYSYGFRVAEPFDKDKHPTKLKERRVSGEEYCCDVFHKCIEVGQCLKFGEKVRFEFGGQRHHIRSKLEPCSTELYRSSRADPKFCTQEEDCKRVGKMTHHPPTDGWGNIVLFTAEIEIGETEFKVSVVNGTTRELFETTVDFLDG